VLDAELSEITANLRVLGAGQSGLPLVRWVLEFWYCLISPRGGGSARILPGRRPRRRRSGRRPSETIRQFLYFYAKRVRTCLRLGEFDGFSVGAVLGAVR